MSASIIEVRRVAADRDTRCRNCWGRIARHDPVITNPGGEWFHPDCRPVATAFPVIGSIDEDGSLIDPGDGDHSYSFRRSGRMAGRR